MTATLYLHPQGGVNALINWALYDGGIIAQGVDMLGDLPQADAAVLLLPGERVVTKRLALPARSQREARMAAPFALEEQLATPAPDLHFALSRADAGQQHLVAYLDKSLMVEWINARADLDIVPDYFMLPQPADGFVFLKNDGRVLTRLADGSGLAVEEALWPHISPALPAEGQEIKGGIFTLFSGDFPLSLRQGAYKPSGQKGAFPRPSRLSMGLAAAVALVFIAQNIIATVIDTNTAHRLEAAVEAELRVAFPDIERIVNPRAQMRARLAQLGGGEGDVLRLSNLVFSALEGEETMVLDSLRFNADEGVLRLTLFYGAYADMERMKTALAARGAVWEEGASRQSEGRIQSDVVVRLK